MSGLYAKIDAGCALFDAFEYRGSPPLPIGRQVAPLRPEQYFDIGFAVQQASPPPKWIDFGLAQITSRAWYEWHWFRGRDPDATYQPLLKTQRRRIIERDGYVCGICGGDVATADVHIDHIVPRALCGPDTDDNLQVAHSSCNVRKGSRG